MILLANLAFLESFKIGLEKDWAKLGADEC